MILVLSLALAGQLALAHSLTDGAAVRLRAVAADDRRQDFHGVLLGDDRILTTRHALVGAVRLEYRTGKGWRRCAVVRHDPTCDLALLATRVRAVRLNLAYDSAAPGDPVLVGGTKGVLGMQTRAVGARRERLHGVDAKLLELDMLSVRGDSGRPVFNQEGKLVGIIGLSDDHDTTKAIDIVEIRYFLGEL